MTTATETVPDALPPALAEMANGAREQIETMDRARREAEAREQAAHRASLLAGISKIIPGALLPYLDAADLDEQGAACCPPSVVLRFVVPGCVQPIRTTLRSSTVCNVEGTGRTETRWEQVGGNSNHDDRLAEPNARPLWFVGATDEDGHGVVRRFVHLGCALLAAQKPQEEGVPF